MTRIYAEIYVSVSMVNYIYYYKNIPIRRSSTLASYVITFIDKYELNNLVGSFIV